MRELLAAVREAVDEQGASHPYWYYILVDEMEAGGLVCESYGVKVVGAGGEDAEVRHVTVRVERIDALMELLTRNVVTPVTLRDVVEDWL